ncbi:MAG TPA: heavy metal-binding domain-containing protein, partial [Chitinophagales bacterium]|nr:heavy metal-binding domain-containing protein [Chitinophagales bacterium]
MKIKKLLVIPLIGALLFSSCSKPKSDTRVRHDDMAWLDTAEYYYTCSMHPTVKLPQPGDCPICFMPLVKTKVQRGNIVELTEREQMLA